MKTYVTPANPTEEKKRNIVVKWSGVSGGRCALLRPSLHFSPFLYELQQYCHVMLVWLCNDACLVRVVYLLNLLPKAKQRDCLWPVNLKEKCPSCPRNGCVVWPSVSEWIGLSCSLLPFFSLLRKRKKVIPLLLSSSSLYWRSVPFLVVWLALFIWELGMYSLFFSGEGVEQKKSYSFYFFHARRKKRWEEVRLGNKCIRYSSFIFTIPFGVEKQRRTEYVFLRVSKFLS